MCWAQFIGMGAQAGGGIAQGAQDAGTLNANADLMDVKAGEALVRGGINEDIQRNKTAQVAGSQRAAMGSSGIDINSGSNAEIQVETAKMGELDAQTIRNNAMRESWDYTNEAANLRQQAVQAGMMQRLLMPGIEDKSGKPDIWAVGQRFNLGNPKKFASNADYIKSGKT